MVQNAVLIKMHKSFYNAFVKTGLGFYGFMNELETILINTCFFIRLGYIHISMEWVVTKET